MILTQLASLLYLRTDSLEDVSAQEKQRWDTAVSIFTIAANCVFVLWCAYVYLNIRLCGATVFSPAERAAMGGQRRQRSGGSLFDRVRRLLMGGRRGLGGGGGARSVASPLALAGASTLRRGATTAPHACAPVLGCGQPSVRQ